MKWPRLVEGLPLTTTISSQVSKSEHLIKKPERRMVVVRSASKAMSAPVAARKKTKM